MSSIKAFWCRRGLQVKIFISFVAVVIVLMGGVLVFSYQRASRLAQESLERALATTRSLYENLTVERLEKLELVNSAVVENPIFTKRWFRRPTWPRCWTRLGKWSSKSAATS